MQPPPQPPQPPQCANTITARFAWVLQTIAAVSASLIKWAVGTPVTADGARAPNSPEAMAAWWSRIETALEGGPGGPGGPGGLPPANAVPLQPSKLPKPCMTTGRTWQPAVAIPRFASSVSDGLAGRAYVPVRCSLPAGSTVTGAATAAAATTAPQGQTWTQHYTRPCGGWAPFTGDTSGSAFYDPFAAVCDEI
jgi:hypothetical protein